MPHPIDERLAKLGVTLPDAPSPAANYLPYIISGNQLLIAGQAAEVDGKHVRTVMGTSSLRSGTALVIDAIFEKNI